MRNRVLIVEDSKDVTYIFEVAQRYGLKCVQISNFNEAFERLQTSEDIIGIILDMQFPITAGLDKCENAGKDFLEKMEKEHIGIPVLINSLQPVNFSNYLFVKGQAVGSRIFDIVRFETFFQEIVGQS